MIRIRDIHVQPAQDQQAVLLKKAAAQLHIPEKQIVSITIARRSIDARKKNAVVLIYTVDVTLSCKEEAVLSNLKDDKITKTPSYPYDIPKVKTAVEKRPVVVGFGPAGMFAALVLAEAGLKPIVLERGASVDERTALVKKFWQAGELDPDSNVQFGEGGAGTFSDGKLNSGISDNRVIWVLNKFYEYGADISVTYDALPHVGTDKLVGIVKKIRERIISLGGEVRFKTKMERLIMENGSITGVDAVQHGITTNIATDQVILAIGHSARDTFTYLAGTGIAAEQKSFSMGVRIEHLQSDVDASQFGEFAGHKALGPAPYKLNCKTSSGSAYTFCMCPGGYVVAAASEEGRVVTNGMSYSDRSGKNANAALLVTLTPDMFPSSDLLAGVHWQQEIEHTAFIKGGSDYHAPAQLVGDFLTHKPSKKLGRVVPTYQPGVTLCNLEDVLPKEITSVLHEAIPMLDHRLKGFAARDAVMTAPETRSSSPIRLIRDKETLQSVSFRGLWPCGEGAGYAGGIISAAVDGMRCAEKVLSCYVGVQNV